MMMVEDKVETMTEINGRNKRGRDGDKEWVRRESEQGEGVASCHGPWLRKP
jgi:hypothetical protein